MSKILWLDLETYSETPMTKAPKQPKPPDGCNPAYRESGKINVRLPALLIRRIDQFVADNPNYGSRSGFLYRIPADIVIGGEER